MFSGVEIWVDWMKPPGYRALVFFPAVDQVVYALAEIDIPGVGNAVHRLDLREARPHPSSARKKEGDHKRQNQNGEKISSRQSVKLRSSHSITAPSSKIYRSYYATFFAFW